MFIELLKQNKKIRVYDKNGIYTETTFYYNNGNIYYNNDEIGHNCKHDLFTEHNEKFNIHIANMISENFCIEIY